MSEVKKVNLELVGLDGNAFALLGAFRRQARIEGWDHDEISMVMDEAMSGDYNHLLRTLMEYCESTDEIDEDWERDYHGE